jgi:glyceraldehyde-3-phosphate dehydrogenase (NAD(P))
MGVIGKRLVDAVTDQPDMTLSGVVVRSAGPGVLARPGIPAFAFDADAAAGLTRAGVRPRGDLDDLLATTDVVVDAGPSRSGAGRVGLYRSSGVSAVFCGGERDRTLGPLIHSALNYETAVGSTGVRLASCNTTALGRLVAAVGPEHVARLTATVVRCATDSDKASKGVVNGAVLDSGPSHHASDLQQILPSLRAESHAITVPMTSGHVIGVRIQLHGSLDASAALGRLTAAPRTTVLGPGPHSTSAIKASAAHRPGHRGDRHDLAVALQPTSAVELVGWLSLDTEAVTIPETLDVIRAVSGMDSQADARALTDKTLPPSGHWAATTRTTW